MKDLQGLSSGQKYKKQLYKIDKKLEDLLFKYKTSLLVLPEDPQDVKDRFPMYSVNKKLRINQTMD